MIEQARRRYQQRITEMSTVEDFDRLTEELKSNPDPEARDLAEQAMMSAELKGLFTPTAS
jgi:hypothetical protein